jgi:hypothetical protein
LDSLGYSPASSTPTVSISPSSVSSPETPLQQQTVVHRNLRTKYERIPTIAIDDDFVYSEASRDETASGSEGLSSSSRESEDEQHEGHIISYQRKVLENRMKIQIREENSSSEDQEREEKRESSLDEEKECYQSAQNSAENEVEEEEQEEEERLSEKVKERGECEEVEGEFQKDDEQTSENEKDIEIGDKKMGEERKKPKTDLTQRRFFSPEELLKRLCTWRWNRTVETCLRQHFERINGRLSNDNWKALKTRIELFWLERFSYVYDSVLESSPFEFWEEVVKSEHSGLERIALELMSTSASEACCERGLSFVRVIFSKRRRRLSLRKLTDCMILRHDLHKM